MISRHIEQLLATSDPRQAAGSEREWTRASIDTDKSANISSYVDGSGASDDGNIWAGSVLELYMSEKLPRSCGNAGLLDGLATIDVDIVPRLAAMLSSNGTNDAISSELVELLGFDQLDLIMKLLNNRPAAVMQLSSQMASPQVDGASLSQKFDGKTFSRSNVRRRMQEQLDANASRPLFTGTAVPEPEILPNVYTSSKIAPGNIVSQLGSKYMLPLGTERIMHEEYEEVIIPPAKQVPPRGTERLITINELDDLVRGSFTGYSSLNRIQSIVFPTAYGTNENLLICAPTGAGKTDVAMLTILRVLNQHKIPSGPSHPRQIIDKDAFKIIYVAPMKALASEIVRKLGKRLQWLSIEVRELTGDMQMTKAEIAKTQVIVTTPEKWDVVTRKPTGEGEIASKIKLLVIDEVHLLNEERGAVIETIVARTLRQVESSQSMIRIVGLSATLPNYRDVSEFLCASRHKGLFYFDSSFRPVPLQQHFLGIKGKPNSLQSRKNLDHVTFLKVSDLVQQGHQVMVFVHARKETVKTATLLSEMSKSEGNSDDFSCEDHPQYHLLRQKMGESRNKEMKQLFDSGFGIHHAGMLRADRNLTEKLFLEKAIKVLCCTATLAWGVNLPAHAVIIKGTQVYDSGKGKFVDLSVLDVLQIFGRAGRPGLETSGEGFICTTEDKLTHYLDAVTSSVPIESQFRGGLVDALNAEIALGTVSSVKDAVQWLGYTYLFVRMRINPLLYGISHENLVDDPQLVGRRTDLTLSAAKILVTNQMITHDAHTGHFQITDLGRIAARYYIRHASIEIFNQIFRPSMSEADVLAMLSKSTEFDQIQVRENETRELETMLERVPCDVPTGIDTSAGKVNVLLQGFISRELVEDFALISDMAYIAQNAARIVRALLEIAMSKKWANSSATLIGISKSIESRLWPYDHPLRQFSLKANTIYALEQWADDLTVPELASYDPAMLGQLVHQNDLHGQAIVNAAKQFPKLHIECRLQPLSSDVLKISLDVIRSFDWNIKTHASSEPFWLWVEDQRNSRILQLTHIAFYVDTTSLQVEFFIALPNGALPDFLTIRAISDHWVGSEDIINVNLDSLKMPSVAYRASKVIHIPFLCIRDVGGPLLFKDVFSSFDTLNALQTQSFWKLVHSKRNALLSAPAGCGKSTIAQMSLWMDLLQAGGWVLVVHPTKVAALETISELQSGSHLTGFPVQSFIEKHGVLGPTSGPVIRIATAKSLMAAFSTRITNVDGLTLVICEGLEQLDPLYELALSLLRLATQFSSTRFIGTTASLNDPSDLASWLGVDDDGISAFLPKDRDQSLTTSTQTFSIPHSASLFKAMARPAHRAIQRAEQGSSVLIFVPSRNQCRSIAQDLITQCSIDMDTARGYVPKQIADNILQSYASGLRDRTLVDFITKGVGIFHQGIYKEDRLLQLSMFAEGIIRVLVTPRDSCWSIPVRAATVIVMGTQYVQIGGQNSSQRHVKDYSLTELVRMQSRAIQHSTNGHFHLFCQPEPLETYTRFLDSGLPLESQLQATSDLRDWIQSFFGANLDKQALLDILSFTFLARRLVTNPSYYGFGNLDHNRYLSAIVDSAVKEALPAVVQHV